MNRTQKILFGLFVLLVLFFTYLEASEPDAVNWNSSYSKNDKIPLGTFVLFQNLKNHESLNVKTINTPPYEHLVNEDFSGTYMFINDYISFDEAELDQMLQWVGNGNHLFISARNIGQNLLDTLGLRAKNSFLNDNIGSKPLLELVNPAFQTEEAYLFDHNTEIYHFSEIDTLETTVLGFTEAYDEELKINNPQANYIEQGFGQGKIYLHLTPEAFSNYFLLSKNNLDYTENALSYLDTSKEIIWDNYYKTGKAFNTSFLYVLLKSDALKWAYYFMLVGILLFILFEGKRKQRSVTVVKPLENQTYNYTQTIAGLYLEKNQNKEIALKKINLFLEHVRTHWRVKTDKLDKEFYEMLAARSGNSIEETEKLFEKIKKTRQGENIGKKELRNLSNDINTYKYGTYDRK